MFALKSIFGIIQKTNAVLFHDDILKQYAFLKDLHSKSIDQSHNIFYSLDHMIDDINISNLNHVCLIVSKFLNIGINIDNHHITLASDGSGRGTFYYVENENILIYSDRLDWILSYQQFKYEVDQFALIEFIFFNVIFPPRTLYKNVAVLEVNHQLNIHYNGDLKLCYKENFFDDSFILEYKKEYFSDVAHDDISNIFNAIPLAIKRLAHPNVGYAEAYFYHLINASQLDHDQISKLLPIIFNFQLFPAPCMRLSALKKMFINQMAKKYFKLSKFDEYLDETYQSMQIQYEHFVEKYSLHDYNDDHLFNFVFHYPIRLNNIHSLLQNNSPYLFDFHIDKRFSTDKLKFAQSIQHPFCFQWGDFNKRFLCDGVQRIFYDKENGLNALFSFDPFSFNRFISRAGKSFEYETNNLLLSLMKLNYLLSTD